MGRGAQDDQARERDGPAAQEEGRASARTSPGTQAGRSRAKYSRGRACRTRALDRLDVRAAPVVARERRRRRPSSRSCATSSSSTSSPTRAAGRRPARGARSRSASRRRAGTPTAARDPSFAPRSPAEHDRDRRARSRRARPRPCRSAAVRAPRAPRCRSARRSRCPSSATVSDAPPSVVVGDRDRDAARPAPGRLVERHADQLVEGHLRALGERLGRRDVDVDPAPSRSSPTRSASARTAGSNPWSRSATGSMLNERSRSDWIVARCCSSALAEDAAARRRCGPRRSRGRPRRASARSRRATGRRRRGAAARAAAARPARRRSAARTGGCARAPPCGARPAAARTG